MAITKIQCLNEAHTGNPAAHLKNALSYIQNPEKTEENVLVGSINCLPDTAFEQMMDTKVTFGKTNKRQGYHIIISFAPGEATEEQALDIVARFAQEYLKDKYEAVYAVHNDKKHMHGHIVFNSVSFETGMKHECKKGEWKHRMQPITNRLCKEYGLSIVPAEYVKEPKNLSRKEWEREQCFRKMILADAEFCQSQAGSFDHFIFLMKRIGYQFEYGKYLSVKVPGGKWYHELDKLDERFSEEKFRFYLDMPFTRPVFVVGNTVAIHKRGITDFQMKYYRRIYQARMVEQRRFDKHSAYLAKELERMNQLQEQYLFLVNNNIKTVEGLVTYQVLGERDVEKISERQQELYQQNRARKRACKTEEDIRDYQIWHMGVQAELDELKAEKKALNKNMRIAEGCVEEYKKFSMLDFSTIEDEIRNSIEVPKYPYAEEKNIALSVNDAVSDMGMDGISVMNESEDYETSLGAEVCEQISAEDTMDATVGVGSEANIVEKYVGDWSDDKDSYETYKKMTPMEKAQMHGFRELKSYDTVRSVVQMKFLDMGHIADVDEILEETDLIYKGMCELVVKNKTEEAGNDILAQDGVECKSEDILLRKVLETTKAGTIAYTKVPRKILKTGYPDNKPEPYMYFNCEIKDKEKNKPVLFFTRKPGMIVSYEDVGNWVDGISASSKDEFIFAIFVLNSENKLTNTREPYSLEEYVRKSEMADHTSWGDFSMGNNNPRIVSKVQAQINSKISKEFFVEEEDTTSRLNSGLGKMFGDLLLPPENFGKKPSGGTSGGQGGSGHTETHKNVVFGYESSKTKYFSNGMTVKLTIKSRRKILATGINLAIDSETGAIKPKDWEEKMGLSMPFEIVSADIVVTKVDKLKTNLKMAVDSSNESSGISDISCELLKTKNGAGYGIHVRSGAEHLIEMELDITLQLNRKDIKPLFNVEKNEGDK